MVYAFSTNALKASDPNHSPNSGESNDGTPPAEAEDDDAGAAAFSGAFLLIALFILNNMNRPPYPPIIAIATEYEERVSRRRIEKGEIDSFIPIGSRPGSAGDIRRAQRHVCAFPVLTLMISGEDSSDDLIDAFPFWRRSATHGSFLALCDLSCCHSGNAATCRSGCYRIDHGFFCGVFLRVRTVQ